MRSLVLGFSVLMCAGGVALAQTPPPAPAPGNAAAAPGEPAKKNANPCREEVAAALGKLRKTSWFRMNTSMITEHGPTTMEIDYILPDRMHQKVTQTLTNQKSEVILVGDKAWGNEGKGWQQLENQLTQTLKTQMYESVVEEQADIGEYSCKGKVQHEGRDVMAYKLEQEAVKDSTAPMSETFRMFYVDALTGLPMSNALLSPGRETKPLFKTNYSYPVDIKIEAPKEVATDAGAESKK